MTARARRWLALLAAVPALLGAAAAQAAFTFTRVSSPTFYIDTSVTPQLPCNYVGFAVTSSTAVADAWAGIGSYSSLLGNSPYEDGRQHLGSFSAGQTRYAYFYVCSSYATVGGVVAGEGYTVSMYDRNPALAGAATLGSQSFTTTVSNDVIQANPNQVSVIFAGPNPGVLGGIITMTVEGATGTIGSAPGPNGPLAFTPAAFSDWRADAYELVSANVTLSGGNSGSYDNQLYFPSLPSSGNTQYVVTYQFRAVTTTSTATNLSPIAEIASGTQVKHTSTSSGAYGGQLLPIDSATNALRLSKLVSAATLPNTGGTVAYTLRLTNSSSYAIVVDDFVDTLPAGVSYVSGSSTYGGVAIGNPFQAGQQLTWNSTFTVPGNASRDLVFQAVIPATGGLYTNSAIAHIGSTVIDTTLTTTDNAPATATTRVLGPAAVTKSFTPVAVAAGNPLTLTITLTNNNTATTLTGLAVDDTYPAGLVNHSTPNAATTCPGGALSGGVPGGASIGVSGVILAPGASCTVTVSVTSATSGAYTNTTGNVTSTNGGSGGTASALVTFTSKPALTKSFSPASVPLGSTSRVTILVTNNNTVSLTALGFADPLPAGLSVATTPNLSNTCGGSVTGATFGSTNVALSGGAITLPATSCEVAFDVVANAAGTYSNVTTGASSTETGSAGPVSNAALLTVMAPPAVSKAFDPAAVARNERGTLTITLSNPNAAAITGVAFTDSYPAGLVNAAAPAATTTCGGTVTAAAGGNSVALAGGSIPAGGLCTVSVNVTSSTAGTYDNVIGAGGVTSANAGSNTVAAAATLTVTNKPSIAKAFAVDLATGVTTMTITVTNNHTTGLTGLAFGDPFPPGMVVDATPALTNSCGGTVTGATAGSTSLSLAGGAIATAGGSCTLSIRVAVNTAGEYGNQASGVSSTQTGSAGNPSNVAVLVAPGLTKSFSPGTIGPGDVARMTVTVTNPSGTMPLTGLQFSDTYPAGMVNTATPAPANTCGGATTGGAASGNAFGLTGGTLAPGATCSISINVTSNAVGSYYNQTGTVRSLQGVGTDGADTLYVTARPTITKSFSPATILAGGVSTMTLLVENNHTGGITGLAFTDPFPSGLVVRTPATNTNTCGGTLAAAAGSSSVALTGGAIGTANGTCTITVQVTAAAQGSYANQTNGATSTTTGATPGPRSNVAILQVNLPAPTVAKAFSPATVGVNTTSTLTITLTNNAAEAVTGVNFTDTYPAGLVNSGGNDVASTCGGVATAVGGSGSLALVGGTIPAGGSCTVTVSVQAAAAGAYVNTTGDVTTANAGTAAGAQATLTVLAAISATKSFAASPVGANVPVSMSIVVSNPNAQAATGVAFTDTYPAGLVNAAAPAGAIGGPGCSGTVTAAAGGNSLVLSGATIPASGSCTVTANVQAGTAGSYVNSIAAGAITSANAGANAVAASATLTVLAPATISKAFAPATVAIGATSTLTFTLGNTNAVALTGGAFTDAMTGMVIDANGPAGGTCTGAAGNILAANQANLSFTGLTIPAAGSCTVTVVVRATATGTLDNVTSGVSTGQTAAGAPSNVAQLTVTAAAPTVAKGFTPATIDPGATSQLVITLGNPNAAAITVTTLTDNFPAGLSPAAVPNAATTCAGGTVASNATSVTLTGGTVPANGSCTVILDVTSTASGQALANTIAAGQLTTSVGANTAAGAATLTVRPAADLSVAKAGPVTVAAGGAITYTIVVSNAGPQGADGAVFSDAVPAAVLGVAATCGAATGGAACGPVSVGGNAVTSTIPTLPAGASVTFTVTGTAPTSGSFTNTATVVTSSAVHDPTDPTRTAAGNNRSAVTTAIASPDLAITKAHVGSFTVGTSGSYTLTVNNTAGSAPTSGTITVTDNLPNGLTYVSGAGTGWSCAAAGQAVTCTTSAVIAAGAVANAITLTVAVGAAAAPSVINTASVSGGGEPAAVSGNNSASDPTSVLAAGTSSFVPDNTMTASAGTTVNHPHTFTAGAAGTVTFSATSVQSPAVAGWTQTIYRDSDCSGTLNGAEGLAPISGGIAVNAGDQVCIVVRDAIPLSAPQNAQNAITVTATLNAQALTRTDLTLVGAGSGAGLVLNKQVRNLTLGGAATTTNTARPNDLLEYTVTYTNTGAGAVTAMVITDSTPSFTLFQAAACALPLPASLTACTVTTQPAVNGTGSISWTFAGSLSSGASGTVTFTVRVQP